MKIRIAFITLLCGAFLLTSAASAQPRPDKDWKSWFGHVDGSFSMPQGDSGDVLDDGWSLGGGATYWPETWPVGLTFGLDYSDYGISREAIDFINDQLAMVPENGEIEGGDVTNWAVSLDASWSPSDTGSGFYLVGGVSVNFLEGRLTNTGLVYYPPVCDPWWWWCIPGGIGPGTVVRASESATRFGYGVGVGWAFEVGLGSQVYVDVRYQVIDTDPARTELFPITVGYRW